MRGRSNTGARLWGAKEGAPAHHGPGQGQVRKEILWPTSACRAPGTLGEVYLAPWAAGERVSLAMRMPAMLEETGDPDPLPKKRRKKKSPSFLIRPEKTEVELEHQPHQAGPLPYESGSSRLCDLPFCIWPPREDRSNKTEILLRAGDSTVNRGLRRQHQNREGKKSQERLEPTLFLVGCGFRTLIAPQQDRIGDSHIKTP